MKRLCLFTESSLKPQVRTELHYWRGVCASIRAEIEGGTPKMTAYARAAIRFGRPQPTIIRHYIGWMKWGDEFLVSDYHKIGVQGLPMEFRDWCREFHLLHQRERTAQQVFRMIVQQWRDWRAGDVTKAIPGYLTPPEPTWKTGLPLGWSYSNLTKKNNGMPSRAERVMRRKGMSALREHLPSVIKTRIGLEFGAGIQIDDQVYDTWLNVEGMHKATRAVGFDAMEMLSAHRFSSVFKPVLWDESGDMKKMLTGEESLWFIVHFLTRHGYRADIGTTIFGEHGTAHMERGLLEGLQRVTDGKIKFRAGGIVTQPILKDTGFLVESTKFGPRMMAGQPKGNFKHKADIEGSFALLRTVMSHLRAPTGTRLHAPEEDYALQKYNAAILKAAEKISPQRAALLIKPVMTWQEFADCVHWANNFIAKRDWHNLEGWEECKFMEQVVRLNPAEPDQVITYDEIMAMTNPDTQAHFMKLLAEPPFGAVRRMSPLKVFSDHEKLLTRLQRHHWGLCIPIEYAHKDTVQKNHTIAFKHRLSRPGERHTYFAKAYPHHGRPVNLHAGEDVLVYCNPFDPAIALVCEPNGIAIGLIKEVPKTMKLDKDGALRVYGQIEALRAEITQDAVAGARATLAAEREHMHEHNARVIAGKPVTEEEREAHEAAEEVIHFDEPPTEPFEDDDADVQFSD